MDLEILYQDEDLVAINKPAGLLIHRSDIDFHEQANARDLLQQQLSREVYPIHRLDKPTSGVQLFALNKPAAQTATAQFRDKLVAKQYIAVVRGYTDSAGTIDNPVKDRDAPNKPRKDATTRFRQLGRIELPVSVDGKYPTARYSMVELEPLSGRRHQLRQHMKHSKHPIIGDTSYGKSLHNQFFSNCFSSVRLLLHAVSLSLCHPTHGRELTIVASAFDQSFTNVLEHRDWNWIEDNNPVCQQFCGTTG